MKKKKLKKKPSRRVSGKTLFVLLLCCLVSWVLFKNTPTQEKQSDEDADSPKNRLRVFEETTRNCVEKPIREGYEPVRFFNNVTYADDNTLNGDWYGTGLARVKDNKILWIATAGHIFDTSNTYYVLPVRKNFEGKKVWPVESAVLKKDSSGKVIDYAIASVGKPRVIPRLWIDGTHVTGDVRKLKEKNTLAVVHSITGKSFPVIAFQNAMTANSTGAKQKGTYVVDWSGVGGESGTAFFGPEKDDFFTFCASAWITSEELKTIGLGGKARRLAIMTRWQNRE